MSDTQAYRRLVVAVFLLVCSTSSQAFFFDRSEPCETEEQPDLAKFGDYFLSLQDAEVVIRKAIQAVTNAPEALNCLTNASRGSTPWERCDNVIRVEGCCPWTMRFQTPEFALTFLQNENVSIVHYKNRKQMFSWEDCSEEPGCTDYCTCQNVVSSSTAVVKVKSGKVGVRRIKYKGCCKCLNTYP